MNKKDNEVQRILDYSAVNGLSYTDTIVMYVLNNKMPNGDEALNKLSQHNKNNSNIDNIYECCRKAVNIAIKVSLTIIAKGLTHGTPEDIYV